MFVDVKLRLYQPIVPKMICLALTLLLLWQITAGLISCFTLDKKEVVAQIRVITPKTEANQQSLKVALKTAFFGTYVPANLQEVVVKQSLLDLKVVGIMYSKNLSDANVIIRSERGEDKTYRIGETLPGGAEIKQIKPTEVIVMRNGILERLSLPKNEIIFEAPAKPLGMQ